MTGLREELDICAIAHQIEIKNAFLNDLLSNALYTSSNCNTEIGAQQNKKNTTAATIDRLNFIWRERIYEGETPNRSNQKLLCLQFSG